MMYVLALIRHGRLIVIQTLSVKILSLGKMKKKNQQVERVLASSFDYQEA